MFFFAIVHPKRMQMGSPRRVGPLATQNQTLWLPKSFSNPAQTCNKTKQGYLVEVANSQKQIKLYLVQSDLPTSLPRLSSL